MVLDWMRRESERRLDRGEREARRGETCITRTGLRPYDTLTGFNVVSLRHTGAATLIFSRGGPVPCWEGRGAERVYCEDSHCQGGGRKATRGGEGTLDRERREGRGNYFTVGFVS